VKQSERTVFSKFIIIIYITVKMGPKISELQRQVLNLYKKCLRASRNKPGFETFVREEFVKNAKILKTDTLHIEHLLRRGWRQLKILESQETMNVINFRMKVQDK